MTATILDFVANLVNTLAWPVVVTTLALVFKPQISDILSALQQRIKHLRRATGPANTSVEFDQVAEEADAAALELPDPGTVPEQFKGGAPESSLDAQSESPYFLDDDRRKALSLESPVAALLVSYAELESLIRSFYKETDRGDRPHKFGGSPVRMTEQLRSEGQVSDGFVKVLRPVARSRNAIAHGQIPEAHDRAELRELVEHCATLARLLWTLQRRYRADSRPYYPTPDSEA